MQAKQCCSFSVAAVQQVSEALSFKRGTNMAFAPCKLGCVHVVLQLLPSLLADMW